ncbi:MAG: alcohol dehydrogenase family protein [Acidobacteriota bacterium]|nr:alcohol dehydrogenase family protein [Acidobacteriota bacterium]
MRALTFAGRETIEYSMVDDPGILEPGDAVIKVELTAVCGSDLHVYHGREQGMDHGAVMGHEFMGEVVEIGADVRNIRIGDRVACPFTTSCGRCFYCLTGLTCRCIHGALFGWVENGNGLNGTQAEYVRVPMADAGLLKLPEDVTDEEGLLMGDVFSTGYFAALNAEIHPDRTYVVLGCGPVGLMAVIGALEQGAGKLYAVDCIPERLAMAARYGAIPIDFSKQDTVEIIRSTTEGRGADAVMELVGNHSAHRLAMDLVRPGGIISVAGVHNEPHFAFSPAEAYDKNLTYKVGRCPARHLMDVLLPVVRTHRYDLSAVFSHRMSLNEGPEGYKIFAGRHEGCTKVLLTP